MIENLRFTARLHRLAAAEFERRAGRAARAHRPRALRRPPAGRALGRHEAEARGRQRAAAAAARCSCSTSRRRASTSWRAPRSGRCSRRARRDALVVISTSYLDEADGLRPPRSISTAGASSPPARPPSCAPRCRSSSIAPGATTPRAIARAARALPYVDGARALGRFARDRGAARPDARRARGCCATWRRSSAARALRRARSPVDMESTLLALARRRATQARMSGRRSSAPAGSPSASATSPPSTTLDRGRARIDLRVPRRQRLGQEHDHPHADRAAAPDRGHDRGRRRRRDRARRAACATTSATWDRR